MKCLSYSSWISYIKYDPVIFPIHLDRLTTRILSHDSHGNKFLCEFEYLGNFTSSRHMLFWHLKRPSTKYNYKSFLYTENWQKSRNIYFTKFLFLRRINVRVYMGSLYTDHFCIFVIFLYSNSYSVVVFCRRPLTTRF